MIDALVMMLANQPGLPQRMLDEHTDDGRGRCRGCRWHDRPQPRFPCTLRTHAEAAARLQS
jgi:hypothetical protein